MSQRATCAPTSGAAKGRSAVGGWGIAILERDAIVILALPSLFLKSQQVVRLERRPSTFPGQAARSAAPIRGPGFCRAHPASGRGEGLLRSNVDPSYAVVVIRGVLTSARS